MIQRIRNVIKLANKKARDESGHTKRKKSGDQLLQGYPIMTNQNTCDDPVSIEGHMKGLENELMKSKPRDQILLPLMR